MVLWCQWWVHAVYPTELIGITATEREQFNCYVYILKGGYSGGLMKSVEQMKVIAHRFRVRRFYKATTIWHKTRRTATTTIVKSSVKLSRVPLNRVKPLNVRLLCLSLHFSLYYYKLSKASCLSIYLHKIWGCL